MTEQTLTEVSIHDLYCGDVIWVESAQMFALVKFNDASGFYALLMIPTEKVELTKALDDSGLVMAIDIEEGVTYEKLIEEDI